MRAPGRVILSFVVLTILPMPAICQTLAEVQNLIRQGRYSAAEQALRSMPSLSPEADYLLGFTLIRLYRFPEAEEALRRAVEKPPLQPAWLHALAKALQEQGKNLAAIEVLDRAIALAPQPDYLFAKAMCELNAGDLDSAEADLHRCIERAPQHAEARYKLGKILVDRGDFAGGLEDLRICLQQEPGHLEARFLLGLAASRTGDPETARMSFEAVLREVPGHVGALYNLGRVLIEMGLPAEGRARLDEFHAMSDLSDRIDFISRSVKKNPQNFAGRLELASLLLRAGRTEDALEELLAARPLSSSDPRIYGLLAEAFRRLGRLDDANNAEAFARRLGGAGS